MTYVGVSDHDVGMETLTEQDLGRELTTAEKIERIEASGWPLAWDECHKIYFLQDEARVAHARELGYDLWDSSELRELIAASCPLVFVSRMGYDNGDFADPHNIEQFTSDIYEIADESGSGR